MVLFLCESSIFSYKVDNYYNPDSESGVLWNDLDLNIDWKINKDEIIVSEKDKNYQLLIILLIHSNENFSHRWKRSIRL